MKHKEILYKGIPILTALLLWQGLSALVGMEMLLASPWAVTRRLAALALTPGTWGTVLFSLLRISGGFFSALFAGFVLALIAGRFPWAKRLLQPYVATIRAVPVASFIILCLIWFSGSALTVLISFLIAFPVIYTNVLQGLESVDPKLEEMADLYEVGGLRRFLYIRLPGIKPFLISGCGISVGMAWKAGVAAEVIGVVGNSIGEQLYDAKIYFLNADLLAWTVLIVLLSVAMEKLVRLALRFVFSRLEKL